MCAPCRTADTNPGSTAAERAQRADPLAIRGGRSRRQAAALGRSFRARRRRLGNLRDTAAAHGRSAVPASLRSLAASPPRTATGCRSRFQPQEAPSKSRREASKAGRGHKVRVTFAGRRAAPVAPWSRERATASSCPAPTKLIGDEPCSETERAAKRRSRAFSAPSRRQWTRQTRAGRVRRAVRGERARFPLGRPT